MGSWVGREGRGLQLASTYWWAAQKTLRLAYRHASVARDFIPGGADLDDFSARTDWRLRPDLSFSGSLQYERWNSPALSAIGQTDVTASFQVTYYPRLRIP